MARPARAPAACWSGRPASASPASPAEAASVAHEDGAAVVHARIEPDDLGGLGSFAELLGQLDVAWPPPDLAGAATVLLDRSVLAGAAVDAFREAASRRRLVVVIDDLHWADRSTAAILEHVVTAEIADLFVLATAREDWLEPSLSGSAELVDRLDVIQVPVLDRAGVVDLVATWAGHRPGDERARRDRRPDRRQPVLRAGRAARPRRARRRPVPRARRVVRRGGARADRRARHRRRRPRTDRRRGAGVRRGGRRARRRVPRHDGGHDHRHRAVGVARPAAPQRPARRPLAAGPRPPPLGARPRPRRRAGRCGRHRDAGPCTAAPSTRSTGSPTTPRRCCSGTCWRRPSRPTRHASPSCPPSSPTTSPSAASATRRRRCSPTR